MSSSEIIRQFGEKLVDDIRNALPKSSGKTAQSVVIGHKEDGFTITGNASIGALINGRKPTSKGAKKGSPTLQQKLLEWIGFMGITPRESSMTTEQLSWAMANSIHKKGFKGHPNLLQGELSSNRFDSLTKTILDEKTTLISSQIIKDLQ